MQVLKKIKISLLVSAFSLLSVCQLSAQSNNIGVQAPPFKLPAFVDMNFNFLKIPDLKLDVAPYALKTPYYSLNDMPPAFNSPLADDVLTMLSILNRFDANAMPFFCKMEFQMEKASGFPVKFRLGDVNYVDMLEGKSNYIAPTW